MADKWTEKDIKKMIANPVYAGIGPYPAIVNDDLYVVSAARFIKSHGAEVYLRSMLKNLRKSLGNEVLQEMYLNKNRPRSKLKLYWVTTDDHDEDWFIVAKSRPEAERIHEGAEGYAPGDAHARYVVTLPDALQETTETGWPDNEVVIACGGKLTEHEQNSLQYIMGSGCRKVRFGDRIFCEGDIVTNTKSRLLVDEDLALGIAIAVVTGPDGSRYVANYDAEYGDGEGLAHVSDFVRNTRKSLQDGEQINVLVGEVSVTALKLEPLPGDGA